MNFNWSAMLTLGKGACILGFLLFVMLTTVDKHHRTPFFYVAQACIVMDAVCWQFALTLKEAITMFRSQIRTRINSVKREIVY